MTAETVACQWKILDQVNFNQGVAVLFDHITETKNFYDANDYFDYCRHNNISITHYKDVSGYVKKNDLCPWPIS
jgi:hypothetical protein